MGAALVAPGPCQVCGRQSYACATHDGTRAWGVWCPVCMDPSDPRAPLRFKPELAWLVGETCPPLRRASASTGPELFIWIRPGSTIPARQMQAIAGSFETLDIARTRQPELADPRPPVRNDGPPRLHLVSDGA